MGATVDIDWICEVWRWPASRLQREQDPSPRIMSVLNPEAGLFEWKCCEESEDEDCFGVVLDNDGGEGNSPGSTTKRG